MLLVNTLLLLLNLVSFNSCFQHVKLLNAASNLVFHLILEVRSLDVFDWMES